MGDETMNTNPRTKTGDRIKKAIDDIKAELDVLETKGVDVGDAKAFVKHAMLSLEANDLKKAVLLTVQAKEFMTRARKNHEARGDLLPREAPSTKEKTAIPSPPPKKETTTDTVPSNISELNSRVGDFIKDRKQKGIDMSEAEGLYELSQKEIRLKEYKYLEEHLNQAMQIAERLERQFHERKTKELQGHSATVRDRVDKITELGGDATEITQLLKEANKNIADLIFVKANEQIEKASEKAKAIMDETLRGIYKEKITNVKNELNTLRDETQRNFPSLAAIIRSGILALKEAQYDEIDRIIDEFHKSKENDMNLVMSERLIDKMKVLEKDLVIITDLEIDKGDVDELMFSAREGLMRERFEDVGDILNRSEELITNIKTVVAKDLTGKATGEINELMEDLREKGVDVNEAEILMESVRSAVEGNNYIESYRAAKRTRSILVNARDRYLKNNLEVEIDEIGKSLSVMESKEYFSRETKDGVRKLFDEIVSLYEGEQFVDASKKLTHLIENTSLTKEKIDNSNTVKVLQNKTDILKKDALELNLDILDEDASLTEAQGLIKEYDFKNAIQLFENVLGSLEGRISQKRSENAISKLKMAVNALKENKGILDDIEGIKGTLKRGQELIKDGKYKESTDVSERVLQDIEGIREKSIFDEMTALFCMSRDIIDDNNTLRIDTTRSESLLYRAKFAFEQKEIGSAREMIRSAQALALKSRADWFEKEITPIRELEIDLTTVEKFINVTREHISKDELDEALGAIGNLKTAFDDARTEKAKTLGKGLLTRTKALLEKLSALDIDLEEEKSVFRDAVTAIKEGRYIEGCRITLRAEEKLLEAKRQHDLEMASMVMTEVREMMGEGAELGLDVSSIEEMLTKSQALFDEENFKGSKAVFDETKDFLRGNINAQLLSVIGSETVELSSMIEEANDLGMDVGPELDIVSTFDTSKEQKEYRKLLDTIKETHAALKDRMDARLKEINTGKIEDARNDLNAFQEEMSRT